MKQKLLSLLVLFSLLLSSGLSTQADTATPEDEERVRVIINQASIITRPDGSRALALRGSLGSGCADIPVERQRHGRAPVLFMDLYQVVPAGTLCTRMLIPYSEIIPIRLPRSITQVNVNGVVIQVEATPSVITPDSSIPLDQLGNRRDHIIDAVSIINLGDAANPIWALHVRATQPLGCEFPNIVEQHYDESERWLRYEIYRVIPGNVRCTGDDLPYDENIALPEGFLDEPGAVLEINDYLATTAQYGSIDGQALNLEWELTPSLREMSLIDSVEVVNVTTEEVTLRIIGSQRTGCSFPMRITQAQMGTEITVQVYRAVPEGVEICPAMLILVDETLTITGEFSAGVRHTFKVNDFSGAFVVEEA